MNQANSSRNYWKLFPFLLLAGLCWSLGTLQHHPRYDVPEVDLKQAKALIDSGAVVIDVRDKDKFSHRHIPGAIEVPLDVLRAGIPGWLVKVKASSVVVVYCSKGAVNGSEATHILKKAGFTQAVNLESGLEGWAAAGLPLQTGAS